jgi:hypothetical protein
LKANEAEAITWFTFLPSFVPLPSSADGAEQVDPLDRTAAQP